MSEPEHQENSFIKKHCNHELVTSSVSRLDSSGLSSTCGEATILESLKKIEELKELYRETIRQQAILSQQRFTLEKELKISKSELDAALELSFSQYCSNQRPALEQTILVQNSSLIRPGAIAKIISPVKKQPDAKTPQKVNKYEPSELKIELVQNYQGKRQIHKRSSTNCLGVEDSKNMVSPRNHLGKASGSIVKTNKNARRSIGIQECEDEVRRLWRDSEKGEKRSYLSPRSTFLNSTFSQARREPDDKC